MNKIGGFFEEESLILERNNFNIRIESTFTNGRSALYFILKKLKPTKVYLPYYICNAAIQPINNLLIPYEFIPIDSNLELSYIPSIEATEVIIVVNYFGLKSKYVEQLSKLFEKRLIIDNSQAFYHTETASWTFSSAIKYFGVPDGSIANFPMKFNGRKITQNSPKTDHLTLRKNGLLEVAYKHYQKFENEQSISELCMSQYSSDVLSHIAHESIIKKRRENYRLLERKLNTHNLLEIKYTDYDVPQFYPFLPKKNFHRSLLIDQNIFTPIFWVECLTRSNGFEFEKILTKQLKPLPIDHRYNENEMIKIIDAIYRL